MKKGFTLIEVIISISMASILIICISNINLLSLKNHRNEISTSDCYYIIKSICERFRGEEGDVPEKTVVIYLDNIKDIPENITEAIVNLPNQDSYSIESLRADNSSKKYAAVIKGIQAVNLNVIKVNIYMLKDNTKLSMMVSR